MSTEVQNQKHIDSTIDTIEEHVKNETLTGIPNTLSSWVKTLNEHEELKGIADDLEALKDAIAEKDNEKIVDLMTALGEETTKAAGQAEGDVSKSLKNLGKTLSTAAKTIGKMAKAK